MGFRQCAEEGCTALEYKTVGWCLRHKDQNEPVPMVDYWWTEEDESDPLPANIEHSPHCVCIDCKPVEPELSPVPKSPSHGAVFVLFFLIALPILLGLFSNPNSYEYYDWNNENLRDPTAPESPTEIWSLCKPEIYNAWWTYDFLPTNDPANDTGDLRVFWDADLTCDKSASITVIVTINPTGQFIGSAEKRLLHYTTYGNQWDNKSMLFGDDIDGNGFGPMHPGEYLVDIDILFNYFLTPGTYQSAGAPNEVHMTIELSILSTQGSLMESESTGLWSDWN
jgi:hypothetical protein